MDPLLREGLAKALLAQVQGFMARATALCWRSMARWGRTRVGSASN